MTGTLDAGLLALLRRLWELDPLEQPEVETRLRHLLLDTLACAVTGLREEQTRRLAEALARSEAGTRRLPGLASPLTRDGYLRTFSLAATAFEAPGGLASAHGRPGLHVVPALLAAGGSGTRLGEVLAALAVGYDVGGRIGEAYRILPGMHVDGTWGAFGAAAGLCRLQRMAPENALAAINGVACQIPVSLYAPIPAGSLVRNLYVGHGAMLAASFVDAAAAGMEGPPGGLEAHARTLLGTELEVDFGEREWLVMQGYLKKHPAVKHVHYGIEAALAWRAQAPEPFPDRPVSLAIYPEALTYAGIRAPGSPIEAQFSLSYGTAWTLIHGSFGVEAYAPESLRDPSVRALEARIDLAADPAAGGRTATLRVGDGEPVRVSEIPGDPTRPLTRAEVVNKACDGMTPVLGEAAAEALSTSLLEAPLDTAGDDIGNA